MTTMAVALDRN